jgi:acylphosphatase
MPIERRRVFYSGRVQGVGFRFTAQRIARDRAIAGFARNLPDGRVELVVEGDAEVLDDALCAIQTTLGDNIRESSVSLIGGREPPLSGFSIVP